MVLFRGQGMRIEREVNRGMQNLALTIAVLFPI